MPLSADQIIALLDLEPHPEGGFYRETFRDAYTQDGRAASTAIYFLIKEGQASAWHRVDAVETWHYYAGAPLELLIAQDGRAHTVLLGADLAKGERPQGIVPTGAWQAAKSLGAYTLVGCTVAPGFRFEGFELAPPDFDPSAA
ncbi:MAG: cupin domain-containing protein [Caulobacterales bacterium]